MCAIQWNNQTHRVRFSVDFPSWRERVPPILSLHLECVLLIAQFLQSVGHKPVVLPETLTIARTFSSHFQAVFRLAKIAACPPYPTLKLQFHPNLGQGGLWEMQPLFPLHLRAVYLKCKASWIFLLNFCNSRDSNAFPKRQLSEVERALNQQSRKRGGFMSWVCLCVI